jgi:hypothetical protein
MVFMFYLKKLSTRFPPTTLCLLASPLSEYQGIFEFYLQDAIPQGSDHRTENCTGVQADTRFGHHIVHGAGQVAKVMEKSIATRSILIVDFAVFASLAFTLVAVAPLLRLLVAEDGSDMSHPEPWSEGDVSNPPPAA